MKKIFLSLSIFGLLAFVACSDTNSNSRQANAETTKNERFVDNEVKPKTPPVVEEALPRTTVDFQKTTFDLGDMVQGDKKGGTFQFTNTGTEPLIISSAKGSCGCTVPNWPKEPIAPGESGEISFEFNSKGKKNKQTKTITIQANTDPNPIRLTVKGNVIVPEGADEAKPAKKLSKKG